MKAFITVELEIDIPVEDTKHLSKTIKEMFVKEEVSISKESIKSVKVHRVEG